MYLARISVLRFNGGTEAILAKYAKECVAITSKMCNILSPTDLNFLLCYVVRVGAISRSGRLLGRILMPGLSCFFFFSLGTLLATIKACVVGASAKALCLKGDSMLQQEADKVRNNF